ncbi:hypothetical protein ABZT45_33955 [Streptomyces sp. NPDC005356]|uniref:hypothetical protein n=1 Tax=unclassified Streptomyces TaxID=2593676 RepID=UPI0033ACA21C
MTVMAVGFLTAAVLFTALGIANQRWLQQRLAGRRTGAGRGELTGTALAWRRGLFLLLAAVAAFQGVKGLRLADDTSWNADELDQAVRQATSSLEAEPHLDDPYDDYSSLIRSSILDAGKGLGPAPAVDVEAVGKTSYTVTADGAGDGFCMRISQTESDKGGLLVPGAGDQPSTRVPVYDLKAQIAKGSC